MFQCLHLFGVLSLTTRVSAFSPAFVVRSVNRSMRRLAEAEKPAKAPDGGSSGHVVRGLAEPSDEAKSIQERVAAHQQDPIKAAKLGPAEEIRSLVEYSHGFAVISTNSGSIEGYPSGAVVGFATDTSGHPLFVFSGMSTHTQDLLKDPRCSLTVAAKSFKGAADGRVNLVGDITKVPPEEVEACRARYMAKHPGAFWASFGDFTWFRMSTIKAIRYVGGFARAGALTAAEYREAQPDPIMQFAGPVMQHMNDDHAETSLAMARNLIGFPAEKVELVGLDRLGLYLKCEGGPMGAAKLRLAFPRPAASRKDVKDLIVELTKAANAAAPEASANPGATQGP